MPSLDATIYDIYDDSGALLKSLVPEEDELPDFVKTASVVGQDANSRLFALVMVDDGRVLKKYATADAGNTWLSALYFSLNKDLLPEEAQKVAAANLIEACEAHNIDAPPSLWDIADGPAATNIVDVSGATLRTKVASVREDVPYAIERADGSSYYPLRDAAHVTTAMDYFERNHGQFVPRERREYAVKVAAEAEKGALPVSTRGPAIAAT